MVAHFTFTPYGAAATDALATAVASSKGEDPLAPVTVVVPSNLVGVAARRSLATRPGPGGAVGLAAVRFETLLGLAGLLAQPALAGDGRRRVTDQVVAAAVRTTLADSAELLRPVARHPATERALVRVHRELRELDDAALDAVAATGRRASEVVRLHRIVADRLAGGFVDEVDLHRAAAAIAGDDPLLDELGSLIVHVPGRVPPSGADLLATLARERPVAVVAALTGDEAADAPVGRLVKALGGTLPAEAPAARHPARLAVRSVADPDEEARVAVREVVAAAAAGTPFASMAIVHPGGERHARLLHQHLRAAEVPFNGVAGRRLGETLTGRTLQALLDLHDSGYPRSAVMGLISSGGVLGTDGQPVPSAAWERSARQAGVVAGPEQWRRRLGQVAADLSERRADLVASGAEAARIEGVDRDIGHAASLGGFVEELVATLDPTAMPRGWRELSRWARGLLDRYLGGSEQRADWPPEEVRAFERIADLLADLGNLAGIEARPGPAAFRRAVGDGLDRDLEREGRFGDGVLVGGFGVVTGLGLERVVVVGLTEGTTPGRRRDDPLLPDSARQAAAGVLVLRADRMADLHHGVLAALAAADSERVLVFARGDLGRRNGSVPSRWLLDEVQAELGRRPSPTELEDLDEPWFCSYPSFAGSLERLRQPADEQEYALADLLRKRHRGLPPEDAVSQTDDPVLRRGTDMALGRARPRLTRFDGNLAGAEVPSPADGRTVLSATRLQNWVGCPYAYFMEHVLGVRAHSEPADDEGITNLDRGTLAHRILERFVSEALEVGDLPAPGGAWSGRHRLRLGEICDEEFALAEARGLTGRPLLWQRDSARLRRHLDSFLDDDQAWRGLNNTTPVSVEASFGVDGGDPLVHSLPDGRRLRFRGRIDRVDHAADGTIHVIDYKTGLSSGHRKVSEETPDDRGRYLQIPVYGLAARAAAGTPDTAVHGQYWFVTDGGTHIGHPLSPAVLERFDSVLTTVVDGIEQGLFPARPPEGGRFGFGCDYCDPDGLGTASVTARWEAKRADPALEPYRILIGLLPEPDAPAGGVDAEGGSDA